MRNYKLLTVWLLAGVLLYGCELPKEPNFKTSHKVEAPLLVNKTFQFLGGDGPVEALIDTTKNEDLDSLLTVDENSFISISKEQDFDFGDLNDAVPSISADPTSFNSQVGEIELGSFSSGNGNLGTADFQSITGLNPALVPAGTQLLGGTTLNPINIDVGSNTDFFVSATLKSGAIEITIGNELGFNISQVDLDLKSGNSVVGSTTFNNLDHGTTQAQQINFSEGDVLENLNVDIDVTWVTQNTQAEPGDLVVESINGVNLVASEVEAAVEGQDFSTSNMTTFDDTDFRFTDASHYVELESGKIKIFPIENDLELAIETLVISFPDIIEAPTSGTTYNPADSLVITLPGGIPAASGATPGVSDSVVVFLADARIYAMNNELSYNISAITENTQNAAPGNQTRVIRETDEISSSVEVTNLQISTAFGEIASQTVVLGGDDEGNGTEVLDLFNEDEVELTELDGLDEFSKEIDGLEFTEASLSINYETSIGVPTTIYGAFLGVNANGEEVYLRGLQGTNTGVAPTDPISGLLVNSTEIPKDSLIKFAIQPSTSGNPETFSITFDETNSSVTQFLNNLPSEIRFIGKAIVNQDGTEATISTPLEFDPMISIDLPLAFKTTEAATFTDTTETTDLQDLPGPEDDTNITEALLNLTYENGLPLGFGIKLNFVDSLGTTFLTLPAGADETYDLLGADVDAVTRFATSATEGAIQIALTDEQFSSLNQTSSVVVQANLNTTGNEEVKVRATDQITLSVSAKISIENTVDLND
jgi:hypothetical protein